MRFSGLFCWGVHFGILQWYQSKIFGSTCGLQAKYYKRKSKAKIMERMRLLSSIFISNKEEDKCIETPRGFQGGESCSETSRRFQGEEEELLTSYSLRKDEQLEEHLEREILIQYLAEYKH